MASSMDNDKFMCMHRHSLISDPNLEKGEGSSEFLGSCTMACANRPCKLIGLIGQHDWVAAAMLHSCCNLAV